MNGINLPDLNPLVPVIYWFRHRRDTSPHLVMPIGSQADSQLIVGKALMEGRL